MVFCHISGTEELAEMAQYHHKFRYMCDDLKPSSRVLRIFIQEYDNLLKQLLAATLNLAYTICLSDFDFICVDETIIKATNSPFNVIYYDDALTLLENLSSETPSTVAIVKLLNKMLESIDKTKRIKIPASILIHLVYIPKKAMKNIHTTCN